MKLLTITMLCGALFMGACGGKSVPSTQDVSDTTRQGVTLTVNNLTADECDEYAAKQTRLNNGQVWTASYVDGVCTVQQQL